MSKWKETNKYGIRESKAAYWRYTRRMDKEAEILKELEPNPPTHVDLTGFEDYIQRLREPKEPTMDDNFLIWFDVETSGLDPMSDNLLEVEARITDMKGLQVPFNDDPLIFHRVIRFDDNTPIRAFNSTTIDMHSRNGLIGECMNAEDTLKNVDKQMAVWLCGTGLDPGLMHPAGTNVHFDIRWLDVNMPNTSGILHKLSHRRLDLTSFRLLELAHGGDPYDRGHETTHRTCSPTGSNGRRNIGKPWVPSSQRMVSDEPGPGNHRRDHLHDDYLHRVHRIASRFQRENRRGIPDGNRQDR